MKQKVKFVHNYCCLLVRDGCSDEAPEWDGSVHGRETKGNSKFQLNFRATVNKSKLQKSWINNS